MYVKYQVVGCPVMLRNRKRHTSFPTRQRTRGREERMEFLRSALVGRLGLKASCIRSSKKKMCLIAQDSVLHLLPNIQGHLFYYHYPSFFFNFTYSSWKPDQGQTLLLFFFKLFSSFIIKMLNFENTRVRC